jgi:hypothetical protein
MSMLCGPSATIYRKLLPHEVIIAASDCGLDKGPAILCTFPAIMLLHRAQDWLTYSIDRDKNDGDNDYPEGVTF